MKNDLDILQLNLEYGQIIKFDSKYNILGPSDENFKKYEKLFKNAEIALPVFLLKLHKIEIKTIDTNNFFVVLLISVIAPIKGAVKSKARLDMTKVQL